MPRNPPFDGLGQSGIRVPVPDGSIYVDPYLSDSVAELEGSAFRRCKPAPLDRTDITDAVAVLITHEHLDHCDPTTLGPLSQASPSCLFVVASAAVAPIRAMGLDPARIVIAEEQWLRLADRVDVCAVIAAHPIAERDAFGRARRVGFMIRTGDGLYYHAGDTSVCKELIDTVRVHGPPDVAFLPVNERNFYRDSMGIVGNMTIREAAFFADDIKARTWVPIHWDMFAPNSASEEEIRATAAHVAGKSSLLIPGPQ